MNIHRGFHRIGAVLAIPLAVTGVAVSAYGAFEWARPLIWRPAWEITDPSGKAYSFRYGDNPKELGPELLRRGVPVEHSKRFVELLDPEIDSIDEQRRNSAGVVLFGVALAGFAGLAYCMVRAFAWVIAGFKD